MRGLGNCIDPLDAQPAAPSEEEERTSVEPSSEEEPAQSTQPTGSRLERWHPEAFTDPLMPPSEPSLELGVDSAGLEVTPTAPPTLEELEHQEATKRRRRLGIGLGVGLVVVGAALGAAAAGVAAGMK